MYKIHSVKMWRNKLIIFLIFVIIEMIVVEGSNRTLHRKRVKKGFTLKALQKDLKTLKKQEGALKLVDGDRGIFEGIFLMFIKIILRIFPSSFRKQRSFYSST